MITESLTNTTSPTPSELHFDFLVSPDGLPTLGAGACELVHMLDAKLRKAAVQAGAAEKTARLT